MARTAKRAGAFACGTVCCGLPMLVLLGAVSAGTALVGGVAVSAGITVVAVAMLVARREVPRPAPYVTRTLFAAGGAAAGVGLRLASRHPRNAGLLIAVGVALLACTALIELADTPTG